MKHWLSELYHTFLFVWKLLFRGKETICLLLLGFVLLISMLSAMDEVKEEKSLISVGIADEDRSELSGRVIERIQAIEGYEWLVGEQEALLELLRQGEVTAVCVLRSGYEEQIYKGRPKDRVMLYDNGQGNFLLSDVLAGAMLPEICLNLSYETYEKYCKKEGMELPPPEEYEAFVLTYYDEDMFNFSFDMEFVSVSGEQHRAPSNSDIYVQAIFAIMAVMTGFLLIYTMAPYHRLVHGKLADKVRTLPRSFGAGACGCVLAGGSVAVIFCTAFLILFGIRNELSQKTMLSCFTATLLYVVIMVSILMFMGRWISSFNAYQITMVILVVVFGVFGLVSIVDGVLLPEGTTTWIPNGWYVRKMMEAYQK